MTVRTLISEKFGKEIDDNDTLADLGADPLDVVDLLIDIDERLGIDLPDDAVGMGTTVGEVVAMVEGVTRSSAGRSAGLRPEPSSSGSLGHSAAAANARGASA